MTVVYKKEVPFLLVSLRNFLPHPKMAAVNLWSKDLCLKRNAFPRSVQKQTGDQPPHLVASACLGVWELTAAQALWQGRAHEQNRDKGLSTVTAAPKKKLIKEFFFFFLPWNQRGHG